jgi:alanyl-tRNA synthetase
MAELPENVRKIQEERRTSQRDAKKLTERLAELEAADLLARHAETSHDGKRRIIVFISDDASSSYLAILAAKIVATPNKRVILASRAAMAVVLAQSAGLGGDMGALLRELLAPVGGKGGGSKVFAQGTVPEISALDSIVDAARARS